MPNLEKTCDRTATRPGDMLIRLHTGGIIGTVISKLTGSDSIHGGLAVGENNIIDVNGGLKPDATGSRLMANIYKSSLLSDQKDNEYLVYRCKDAKLAEMVAIQAFPFVRVGVDKSWGYNLGGALSSLRGKKQDDAADALLLSEAAYRSASGDEKTIQRILVDICQDNNKFFCTEWMVFMYVEAAKLLKMTVNVGIAAPKAYPGALVEALDNSADFTFEGVIRKRK